MLLGPPCETWSAARKHPLTDGLPKGPGPLRTALELWGMDVLAICQALWQPVSSHVTKPTIALLGPDESGAFRTSRAKEYPSALSKAIALFFSERLSCNSHKLGSGGRDVDPEVFEFVRHSARLDGGRMTPDYQPV